ncbi:MAG TPA: GNAT family N-acetyltransferase [Actinomycetota bacterium]
MDLAIREARLDDAPAIADISRRGWAAAYAGLLPRDFLARRASAPLDGEWREYMRSMPDRHVLLVAEETGRVVGFVRFGPAADAKPEPVGDAEIYGLYVAPERTGQGIGGALVAAALGRLRERGYRGAVLWPFTGSRAEDFYERAGFRFDGMARAEQETGVEERRWRIHL